MSKATPQLYDSESIVQAMTNQGVTVRELAEETGLNTPTIWKLRTGKNVTVKSLASACRYLRLKMIVGRKNSHNGRATKKK